MYHLSFFGILIGWFIAIPGAYLIAANALHTVDPEPIPLFEAPHRRNEPNPNVAITNFEVSIEPRYEVITKRRFSEERAVYLMLGPERPGQLSPEETQLILYISEVTSEEQIQKILREEKLPGHLIFHRFAGLEEWLERHWPEVAWQRVPVLHYESSSLHWGWSIPQWGIGLLLILICTTLMYHHVFTVSGWYDDNPAELKAYGYLTFNMASWIGRQPAGTVETCGNCLVGAALFGAVVMGGVIGVLPYKWWTTEQGITSSFLFGGLSCILTMLLALGFAILTKGSRVDIQRAQDDFQPPSDEYEFDASAR